ncbi:chitinase [Ralstonia solanacearum]|uniref:Chitinase n=1 Tax=Ralstonia solanacearum TaxID=305 RepID=A0AAD0SA23_RALSL|nr:chitinase [Ralstonia solanacearum]AXV83444.1 chitinase [Ralstonia solanacearum]AXW54576.1 chitinase [Ralstonia solanacearum]CBJ34607.1 putative glycosyl hydrolase or chitinase, carbohydrate-binding family [Ralstonia solanacearum PSI07]
MKLRVSPRLAARAIAALCLSAAASASHATGVYAPYIDITLNPTPLIDQIGVRQGIQQFHLAFVVAGTGCTPSWGGIQAIGGGASGDLLTTLATSIERYRARGGEVSVSFGGAAGTPLMKACTTVPALKTAYQTVIDTYQLTHVDFDIEGSVQQDTAAVTRNFQAVAQLQSDFAAKGKTLHVTLTLPVLPSGLTQDGINTVNAAIANKVAFDTVNVMTMDYGPADIDMGAAAISAAQSLYAQLDTAYKAVGQVKTDAQLWRLVGVTPMIGMNDVQGETFTLPNALSVLGAAYANGYGLVANWSVGRDQACPDNGAVVSPTCSGIVQRPYAFASIFRQLHGHWGTGVLRDPNYGNETGGSTPASSATAAYRIGQCLTYQDAKYCTRW